MASIVQTQTRARVRAYTRFSVLQRLQHLVLIVSFTVLAVTGLPQKFAGARWAESMIGWMGGIESVRVLHHYAAIVLILLCITELLEWGYKIYVERARWSMVPRLQDVRDAFHHFIYNLGWRDAPPRYDRYTWGEKFEYWALLWGTLIMALTGFILWNPILSTRFLPGEIIPAAKAAHGGEAILAVLAVLIWHGYNVHLRTFNRAMITGKLSRHEMEQEHALELERLERERGALPQVAAIAKRRRVYLPFAAVTAALLLFGVYLFVTAETTAVSTVSPRRVSQQVFVPRTFTPTVTRTPTITPVVPTSTPAPPTTTPAPGQPTAVRSDNAIPALPIDHEGRQTCQVCHASGMADAPINPPDHEGRDDSTCQSCHKLEGSSSVPEQSIAAPPPVPTDHEGRTLCVACHTTGYAGSPLNPPDHAGRLDSSCKDCHKEE